MEATKIQIPVNLWQIAFRILHDINDLEPIEKLWIPKSDFAAGISENWLLIFVAGGITEDYSPTNTCEIYDTIKSKWIRLRNLKYPRIWASIIACPEWNLYVFGGVENDLIRLDKYKALTSIEHLNYSDPSNEWEVLDIELPFQTSNSGIFHIEEQQRFIIFGGLDKKLNKVASIWKDPIFGWCIENLNDAKMQQPDSFESNGVMLRDDNKKTRLVFGREFVHIYDEGLKSFTLFQR